MSFGQTLFFATDTLAYKPDTLTGDTSYLIGEKWYISKISNQSDTLIFNKDFKNHKTKFEFDQKGICYVESGWMSCGKYGMDFWLKYKINNNELSILDPDSSFSEKMKGDFIIKQYNTRKMVLIRKK